MQIIPSLNLNGHVKSVENMSLVNAKNIMVSKDNSVLSNENSLKIKTINGYDNKNAKIIGNINCNHEFIVFYDNGNIVRYNEKYDNSKIVIEDFGYHGGKISGTFTYNKNNELIISYCEYDSIDNTDCPLCSVNLGLFEDDEHKDVYDLPIISEVFIPRIIFKNINGEWYKGWNFIFIRYKLNKHDYTQWYCTNASDITDSSFEYVIQSKGVSYDYIYGNNNIGSKTYDYFKQLKANVSNETDISNITKILQITNLDKRYKYYQLAVIVCRKDSTKCYSTDDINITINDVLLNTSNFSKQENTEEVVATYYNYYNVKNIINYKNKVYISNYKEHNIKDYNDFAKNVTIKIVDGETYKFDLELITIDLKKLNMFPEGDSYDNYINEYSEYKFKYTSYIETYVKNNIDLYFSSASNDNILIIGRTIPIFYLSKFYKEPRTHNGNYLENDTFEYFVYDGNHYVKNAVYISWLISNSIYINKNGEYIKQEDKYNSSIFDSAYFNEYIFNSKDESYKYYTNDSIFHNKIKIAIIGTKDKNNIPITDINIPNEDSDVWIETFPDYFIYEYDYKYNDKFIFIGDIIYNIIYKSYNQDENIVKIKELLYNYNKSIRFEKCWIKKDNKIYLFDSEKINTTVDTDYTIYKFKTITNYEYNYIIPVKYETISELKITLANIPTSVTNENKPYKYYNYDNTKIIEYNNDYDNYTNGYYFDNRIRLSITDFDFYEDDVKLSEDEICNLISADYDNDYPDGHIDIKLDEIILNLYEYETDNYVIDNIEFPIIEVTENYKKRYLKMIYKNNNFYIENINNEQHYGINGTIYVNNNKGYNEGIKYFYDFYKIINNNRTEIISFTPNEELNNDVNYIDYDEPINIKDTNVEITKKIDRLLIPYEQYNIYIHYVDKYGISTDGYFVNSISSDNFVNELTDEYAKNVLFVSINNIPKNYIGWYLSYEKIKKSTCFIGGVIGKNGAFSNGSLVKEARVYTTDINTNDIINVGADTIITSNGTNKFPINNINVYNGDTSGNLLDISNIYVDNDNFQNTFKSSNVPQKAIITRTVKSNSNINKILIPFTSIIYNSNYGNVLLNQDVNYSVYYNGFKTNIDIFYIPNTNGYLITADGRIKNVFSKITGTESGNGGDNGIKGLSKYTCSWIKDVKDEYKQIKTKPNVGFGVVNTDPTNDNYIMTYNAFSYYNPGDFKDAFVQKHVSMNEAFPKIFVNYDNRNEYKNEFNKTIRRSNVIQDESMINKWRYFTIQDYINIFENKGDIVNIINFNNVLLIHTTCSLFNINPKNYINSNSDDKIRIDDKDIFDSNYSEMLFSELGYGGLINKEQSCYGSFGYIWFNEETKRFMLLSDKITNIDNNIFEWSKKNNIENVVFAKDEERNRILINFTYNKINKATLSYNYNLQKFIAFHEYNFDRAINTENKLYLINNNYNEKYSIFDEETYNVFNITNNDIDFHNSKIIIMINVNYDVIKFIEYITYKISAIIKNSYNVYNDSPVEMKDLLYAASSIRIYNDFVDTGKIDLHIDENTLNSVDKYKKPYRHLGNWNLNYLRDINNASNGENSIDDERSRICGNYFYIEMEFDKPKNTDYFEIEDFNCKFNVK